MGKTILISSHILLELADLCSAVGIIEQGQMIYTGTVQEIMDKAKVGTVVQVSVANRAADAVDALRAVPGVLGAELEDGRIQVNVEPSKVQVADLAEHLVAKGFRITRLQEEQVNLETAFMRLTKGLVQ